jgi:hypothetical protein
MVFIMLMQGGVPKLSMILVLLLLLSLAAAPIEKRAENEAEIGEWTIEVGVIANEIVSRTVSRRKVVDTTTETVVEMVAETDRGAAMWQVKDQRFNIRLFLMKGKAEAETGTGMLIVAEAVTGTEIQIVAGGVAGGVEAEGMVQHENRCHAVMMAVHGRTAPIEQRNGTTVTGNLNVPIVAAVTESTHEMTTDQTIRAIPPAPVHPPPLLVQQDHRPLPAIGIKQMATTMDVDDRVAMVMATSTPTIVLSKTTQHTTTTTGTSLAVAVVVGGRQPKEMLHLLVAASNHRLLKHTAMIPTTMLQTTALLLQRRMDLSLATPTTTIGSIEADRAPKVEVGREAGAGAGVGIGAGLLSLLQLQWIYQQMGHQHLLTSDTSVAVLEAVFTSTFGIVAGVAVGLIMVIALSYRYEPYLYSNM